MRNYYLHNLFRFPALILIIIALSAFVENSVFAQTAPPSSTNVVISNQASASYTDENKNTYTALSQIITIKISSVRSVIVTPDDTAPSGSAPSNQEITRSFSIKNTGNLPDSYIITSASVTSSSEITALYFDLDKSNTVTPADARINLNSTASPQVAPGSSIVVLAVVNTGSIDSQTQLVINLAAASQTDSRQQDTGKIINSVRRSVILTSPDDPNLPPVKLVENQTHVTANIGQALNYTIAFRNRGEAAARQVLVTDELPAELEYIPNSLRLNNQLVPDTGGLNDAGVNNRRLNVRIAQVSPDEVVRITFQARISALQQNATVVNFATMTGDNFQPVESMRAVAVVNPFGVVYAGRSAGSVTVANAQVTLSTSAENPPLTLPASGFTPNENNQNPYTTQEGGRFNFTLGTAEQIGTQAGSFVLRVEAPDYRSRLISVTIQPASSDLSGLYSATLRALDGQPLAQTGNFALTEEPVVINNLSTLAFNIPLFETASVTIEKSADRSSVEIGDVINYRINIQNRTQTSANAIVIRDQLPNDFIYSKDSALIQDEAGGEWRSLEPETMDGNLLLFQVPLLGPGDHMTLSYRVRVGANAWSGMHINTATVQGAFSDGEDFLMPPAEASVHVSNGMFSMRQAVIGRVYVDVNGNGVFDAGDNPVSDARIYTNKGQFVVTDSAGMYNLPVVEDGALVLALDTLTLPDGLSLADDNRRANKNIDRLLSTPLLGGSLLRQNFALKVSDKKTENNSDLSKSISNYTTPETSDSTDSEKDKKRRKPKQDDDSRLTQKNTDKKLPSDSAKVNPEKTDTKNSASKYLKDLPTAPGTYELQSTEAVEPIAPGSIEIVSPKQNQVIMTSALEFEARVAAGWTISLSVNDVLIGSENIGVRQQFHASQVDGFTFVGINLQPGVNRIVAKAISPEGREGDSKELSVMGRGTAKRLEIIADRKELLANGRDTMPVIVKAFDEWGNPAIDSQVAISISQGNLLLDSASNENPPQTPVLTDANTLNNQITPVNATRQQIVSLENGVGTVKIVSGNAPVEAEIDALIGTIAAKQAVRYVPDLRPSLLVGLAEASFGRSAPQMSLRGVNSSFHTHLGFFFRGRVFRKNLLTIAYDSERSLNRTTGRDRLFELDPLDRAYPVFGDSSTRFEEANSNSKLYARIDRGRSYAMFGDFETEMNQLTLSGYSRKLTGVKLHLENSKGDFISVTGARPGTSLARDVFPGSQLGLVTLSHTDILQGSEIVTLETRDRRNPEIIVSHERLVRSVDYNIDPANGQVFFLRPLAAFDFDLNLVQAIITYEHFADGNASNVYTGRISKRFNRIGLRLGLSFVNQRQEDIGSFIIGGFDGEKSTFKGGKVRFEFAASRGRFAADGNIFNSTDLSGENVSRNGNAFRAELEQPLGFKQSVLRADFTRSDADFFNPFGATVTPGSQRGTISLEMKPRNTSQLRFGFGDERNKTENVDNERTSASVEWTEQLRENLRVKFGYDFRSFTDQRNEDNNVNSNMFSLGAEWKPTKKLEIAVKREQNLGEADPTYPNQTTIAAKYQLNNLTKVFFTQRLAADAIRPISDVTANGFAASATRRETVFGVETKLLRYSALSGRYQIENGINGTDSFAVVGLQNRLPLNKKSALEIGFERGFHLAGQGKSFNSLLLGYSWQNENFRSSVRYELRDKLGFGHIFTAGAAGKIGDNATVLGRFQFAGGDANDQQNKSFQGTAALALRPLKTDRVALLFSYNARSVSQNNSKTFERITERTDTLSTDGLWQASKKLEVYGHFVLKFGENSRPDLVKTGTLTYLTQARAQYALGGSWDVAVEGRFLAQPSSFTRRLSTSAELGYWLTPDLRLGAGYNWTRTYQPASITQSEAQRRGFYFTVTTKLSRIFNLFGSIKGS